jgi:hypothetical protein
MGGKLAKGKPGGNIRIGGRANANGINILDTDKSNRNKKKIEKKKWLGLGGAPFPIYLYAIYGMLNTEKNGKPSLRRKTPWEDKHSTRQGALSERLCV